jgi:hypothetical protein
MPRRFPKGTILIEDRPHWVTLKRISNMSSFHAIIHKYNLAKDKPSPRTAGADRSQSRILSSET